MRRFRCPGCGQDLLEGTDACPHCGVDTRHATPPPSPGERFPEISFGTHELAEEFTQLIDASLDEPDPAPRFFPLLQFASWGSPWMEQYLHAVESRELPCPPNLDLHSVTLRDHLSRKDREKIRHYLPKVQAVPLNVQRALLESLELTEWTAVSALSEDTQRWVKTLCRSGVLTQELSEEERLSACSEDELRDLLHRHKLNASGGRHELVGRVFDGLNAPDWQAFARAKRPGPLVRCHLRLAPQLLTYIKVRRARIRLLVDSLLNRERNARRAAQLEAEGITDQAFSELNQSLPPFHPSCRCRVRAKQVKERGFLVGMGEPDACRTCQDVLRQLEERADLLLTEGDAEAQVTSPELAAVDFYADREWPWRPGLCPRCQESLYKARRGAMLFHACSECAGLWLPARVRRDLFENHPELIGRLDTDFTYYRHLPGHERQTQRCPDCETVELEDYFFVLQVGGVTHQTEVETHRCPQCRGVWFDHAELHLISKERAKLEKS